MAGKVAILSRVVLSMSLFDKIRILIEAGDVRLSAHGYDELLNDAIFVKDIVALDGVRIVQEYPDYKKGPCILVLQKDRNGLPVHVVWGIPAGKESPAVLVTAYRPNSEQWEPDCVTRRRK
jgi:hypothetical protein